MDTMSVRRLSADISMLQSVVESDDRIYRIQSMSSSPSVMVERSSNSPVSPISSTGPICRICHEGDAKEELTSPCRCAGTMKLVHQSCLEKWLSSSNSDTCEICNFKYIIYRQPRPVSEWLNRSADPSEWRNLLGDLICFILLTPLAAVSAYLCFMGAKHYAAWRVQWESSGLICLSVFLISLYVTWCFITIKYYVQSWKEWRAMNQNVYLIEMRQLFPSTTHWSRYVRQPSSLRPAVAVQQHYPSPIREAQSLDRTSNSFDACALSPSSGSAVVGRADAETTDYYSEEMRSLGRRGTTSSDTSMSLVRSSPMSNCIRWCQHGHCQQHPLLAESYSDDTNETVAVTTL